MQWRHNFWNFFGKKRGKFEKFTKKRKKSASTKLKIGFESKLLILLEKLILQHLRLSGFLKCMPTLCPVRFEDRIRKLSLQALQMKELDTSMCPKQVETLAIYWCRLLKRALVIRLIRLRLMTKASYPFYWGSLVCVDSSLCSRILMLLEIRVPLGLPKESES